MRFLVFLNSRRPRFNQELLVGQAIVLLVLKLGLCQATSVRAEEVLLFPSADTTLSENWPGNNLGGLPFANSGTTQNFTTNRALFRFDLAGVIPADAAIVSAQLVLEVTREPADGFAFSTFGLHRVLRDWGEGDKVTPPGAPNSGAGAPADPGEATWTHRFAGSEATWGVPGGQAGLDYLEAASAATTVYGIGDSPYTFGPAPAMIADLQFWLAQPEANFGWMLISQAEQADFTARRFGSREDALNTPYVSVTFLRIPEPSTGALVFLTSLLLSLRRRSGCHSPPQI